MVGAASAQINPPQVIFTRFGDNDNPLPTIPDVEFAVLLATVHPSPDTHEPVVLELGDAHPFVVHFILDYCHTGEYTFTPPVAPANFHAQAYALARQLCLPKLQCGALHMHGGVVAAMMNPNALEHVIKQVYAATAPGTLDGHDLMFRERTCGIMADKRLTDVPGAITRLSQTDPEIMLDVLCEMSRRLEARQEEMDRMLENEAAMDAEMAALQEEHASLWKEEEENEEHHEHEPSSLEAVEGDEAAAKSE